MDKSFITVVTGVNRGIGQVIEQLCAKRKQQQSMVIYAASRVGVYLGLGHSPNLNSVHSLITDIRKEHQGIDILINNAGLNIASPASGLRTYKDQEKIMDVHFRGTLEICRSFAQIMNAHGRIVNLSSLASSLQPYREAIRLGFESNIVHERIRTNSDRKKFLRTYPHYELTSSAEVFHRKAQTDHGMSNKARD